MKKNEVKENMSMKNVQVELLKAYKLYKTYSSKVDNLKRQLLDMGYNSTITTDKGIIKYTPATSVKRLDTKRLKNDNIDIYNKYMVNSERKATISVTIK